MPLVLFGFISKKIIKWRNDLDGLTQLIYIRKIMAFIIFTCPIFFNSDHVIISKIKKLIIILLLNNRVTVGYGDITPKNNYELI